LVRYRTAIASSLTPFDIKSFISPTTKDASSFSVDTFLYFILSPSSLLLHKFLSFLSLLFFITLLAAFKMFLVER